MEEGMTSFQKLRRFYIEVYRPLYDMFSVEGMIPQELHAEIAAAFDHLLRQKLSDVGQINEAEVGKITAHLKRATFDAFKMLFKDGIRRNYQMLHTKRYANVHDGRFLSEVQREWNKAVEIAQEARRLESQAGNIDTEGWNKVFEQWRGILPIRNQFKEWAASDEVARAQLENWKERCYSILWSLLLMVGGAVLGLVLSRIF